MIQQINLYRPEFSNHAAPPSFKHLLLSCGLAAAVLLVIFIVQLFSLNRINTQVAETDAAIQQITGTMEKPEVKSEATMPTISEQITQLKDRLKQLREITSALSSQPHKTDNQQGFSAQINGLARQHLAGISLHRIYIFSGGQNIQLHGSASSPEMAPRYLAALQQDKTFDSVDFGQLQILRNNNSREVTFHLQHSNGEEEQP